MPYGTLELPRVMIDAVMTLAEREKMSIPALLAELIKQRFGFTMTDAAVSAGEQRKKRQVTIPDEVKEMTGIVSLPTGKSDADLIRDAVMAHYGEVE